MEIDDYLKTMKSIQSNILDFLDEEENEEENYQNLMKILNDHNIRENRHEIKSLLILLLKISNNHHRSSQFFVKIEKIVLFFKDEIKQSLSNNELFNLFKNSKRFILFLIRDGILEINDTIAESLSSKKCREVYFLYYLYPYIKPFVSKPMVRKIEKEIPEDYASRQLVGENDNYICQLIRDDLELEFILYCNENKDSISYKMTVKDSIFETNPFLLDNDPTLIEYAAFFGSIKILRYLHSSNVELTPSLWLYAIHGRNIELIQYLADNNVTPEDKTFERCLEEAIKCHHNEIVKFIQEKLLNQEASTFFLDNNYNKNILSFSFHYYNYLLFADNINHKFAFFYLCQYDYYSLVEIYLKTRQIYINQTVILKSIFLI